MAEALPDWFDEDARKRAIPVGLHHHDGFIAVSGRKLAGFLTVFFAEARLDIG